MTDVGNTVNEMHNAAFLLQYKITNRLVTNVVSSHVQIKVYYHTNPLTTN